MNPKNSLSSEIVFGSSQVVTAATLLGSILIVPFAITNPQNVTSETPNMHLPSFATNPSLTRISSTVLRCCLCSSIDALKIIMSSRVDPHKC